jgi:protein-S-isoprenylcysteine O-methyltransferase Ste14
VLAWSGLARPATVGAVELVGALVALCGAAIVYRSLGLVGYAVVFTVCSHVFVRVYEEPILSRQFGGAYDEYRSRVRRWVPSWRPVAR